MTLKHSRYSDFYDHFIWIALFFWFWNDFSEAMLLDSMFPVQVHSISDQCQVLLTITIGFGNFVAHRVYLKEKECNQMALE